MNIAASKVKFTISMIGNNEGNFSERPARISPTDGIIEIFSDNDYRSLLLSYDAIAQRVINIQEGFTLHNLVVLRPFKDRIIITGALQEEPIPGGPVITLVTRSLIEIKTGLGKYCLALYKD